MTLSALESPTARSIVIFVDAKTGLGDISSAVAIADIFHKAGLSAEKIHLSTEESLFEKLSLFASDRPYRVLPLKEGLKVLNVAFSVFYPSKGQTLIPFQQPCLHITECATAFHKSFSGIGLRFGLMKEDGECGVLLDEELIERSFNEAAAPKEALFAMLDPFMQDILCHGRSPSDFSCELFTGYCHFGSSFLAYVLSLAHVIDHDMAVYIPLGPTKVASWIHGETAKFVEQNLISAGVNQLEMIIVNQKEREFDHIFSKKLHDKEGKKITLFVGPLAHKDFKILQLLAHKETICTGDRSHHEALSCNKSYVYEAMSHKAAHSHQIRSLYTTCKPHVIDTYDETVTLLEHVEHITRSFLSAKSDGYKTLTHIQKQIVDSSSAKKTLEESAHMFEMLSTPPLATLVAPRPQSAPSKIQITKSSDF